MRFIYLEFDSDQGEYEPLFMFEADDDRVSEIVMSKNDSSYYSKFQGSSLQSLFQPNNRVVLVPEDHESLSLELFPDFNPTTHYPSGTTRNIVRVPIARGQQVSHRERKRDFDAANEARLARLRRIRGGNS